LPVQQRKCAAAVRGEDQAGETREHLLDVCRGR
jgi:hypothetical protein